MKYQIKLTYLVNSWLQEPRKMAHAIPNLEQFLKAFLRERYTKQLKDLTGTMSPIEREPSLTVAWRGRTHPNHNLQFGPISNSLRHPIILS